MSRPLMPVLSICMPTWQRAPMLRDCLEALVGSVDALQAGGIPTEVVISDNASTDPTAEVVRAFEARLPLRYACQRRNHGAESNLVSAFRLARGELCIYLADDDRLLVEGLLEAIAWLRGDAARSAVYAPWDVRDEVSGQSHGLFYPQAVTEDYAPSDGLRMLARQAARGAFPEIGVYRTRALHRVLPMPRAVHWAHVWAQQLLAEGPVRMQAQPFYRCHTRTRVERDRPQLGNEQARTHVDRYRGGLEVALVEALCGQGPLPAGIRRDVAKLVHVFVARRSDVAARMARAAGDAVAASELEHMAALRLGGDPPRPAIGVVTVPDATGADLSVCVVARPSDASGTIDPDALAACVDAIPALPSVEILGVVGRGDDAARAVLVARGARVVEVDAARGAQDRTRDALLAATGWFVLAIAPGEVLDGPRVCDALRRMAERPACVALCTPAADQPGEPAFYAPTHRLALHAHCVLQGVRPALAVYRTAALHAAFRTGALPTPRTFDAPWAWLIGMARRGEVCVDPCAFHARVGPDRTSVERLRAALEVTLGESLPPGGIAALPASDAEAMLDWLDAAVVAHALEEARQEALHGDPVHALEIVGRWAAWQAERRAPEWALPLVDIAAAARVREAATTTAGWSGLVAAGLPASVLARLEAGGPVEVRALDGCADAPGLVLVATRAEAERVRRDLPPGQVLAWEDVRARVMRACGGDATLA